MQELIVEEHHAAIDKYIQPETSRQESDFGSGEIIGLYSKQQGILPCGQDDKQKNTKIATPQIFDFPSISYGHDIIIPGNFNPLRTESMENPYL